MLSQGIKTISILIVAQVHTYMRASFPNFNIIRFVIFSATESMLFSMNHAQAMKLVHFASVISRHGHFLHHILPAAASYAAPRKLDRGSRLLSSMAINGWNEIWSHLYWVGRSTNSFPETFTIPFFFFSITS